MSDDTISRAAAIDATLTFLVEYYGAAFDEDMQKMLRERLDTLPSAQPERLTDDDFETIRIHLSAQKGRFCNQGRWKEAEEYQRIIDRFMAFASAQPEQRWIPCSEGMPKKTGYYICTCHDGACYRTSVLKWSTGWVLTGARSYWKVIAWLPLPEPYQEGNKWHMKNLNPQCRK